MTDDRRTSKGRRAEDTILQIVPKTVSYETAQELYNLWEEAMAGRLRGLAYVAVLDKGRYAARTIGAADQHKDAVLGAMLRKMAAP